MTTTPSPAVNFVADFDHGILVVESSPSHPNHEDWDYLRQPAHHSGDSVYVRVNPSVEGPVQVSVFVGSLEPTPPWEPVTMFEGVLNTPSGHVVVCDSDDNHSSSIALPTSAMRLVVLADDAEFADNVEVHLAPIPPA